MADIIVSTTQEFEPLAEDFYNARCFAVVDVGVVDYFESKKELIYFGFEFPTEMVMLGKSLEPKILWTQSYTATLDKRSNLRRMLETWRGKAFTQEELKGFHLQNVLGAPCYVNVIQVPGKDGSVRNRIAGLAKLPKGVKVDEINEEFIFNTLSKEEDFSRLDSLKIPNWMKEQIKTTDEYKKYESGPAPEKKVEDEEAFAPIAAAEEDLPF